MGILHQPPSLELINGLRKNIVIYKVKDQWRFRAWPQRYRIPQDAKSKFCRMVKGECLSAAKDLSKSVTNAFRQNTVGSGFTWHDFFMSQCMKGYHAAGAMPTILQDIILTYGSPLKRIDYTLSEGIEHKVTEHCISKDFPAIWKHKSQYLSGCEQPPEPEPNTTITIPEPPWVITKTQEVFYGQNGPIIVQGGKSYGIQRKHFPESTNFQIVKRSAATFKQEKASAWFSGYKIGFIADSANIWLQQSEKGAITQINQQSLKIVQNKKVTNYAIPFTSDRKNIFYMEDNRWLKKLTKDGLAEIAEKYFFPGLKYIVADDYFLWAIDENNKNNKIDKNTLQIIAQAQGSIISPRMAVQDDNYIFFLAGYWGIYRMRKDNLTIDKQAGYGVYIEDITIIDQYLVTADQNGKVWMLNKEAWQWTQIPGTISGRLRTMGAETKNIIVAAWNTPYAGGMANYNRIRPNPNFTMQINTNPTNSYIRIAGMSQETPIVSPYIKI